MMPVGRRFWVVLALLLSMAAIAAQLPASWLVPDLPSAQWRASAVEGTVWRGRAVIDARRGSQWQTLLRVGWQVRWGELWRGRLGLAVESDGVDGGVVSIGTDGWQWRQARLRLPLWALAALAQASPREDDWLGALAVQGGDFACDWPMATCTGNLTGSLEGFRAALLREADFGTLALQVDGGHPLSFAAAGSGADADLALNLALEGRRVLLSGTVRGKTDNGRSATGWMDQYGTVTPDGAIQIAPRCISGC